MRTKHYLIVFLAILITGCANVPAGNRAVTFNTWNGGYGDTFDPGLHLMGPQWDFQTFSVATQSLTLEGENSMIVRSSDGLSLEVDLTVLYSISDDEAKLQALYESFKGDYTDQLLIPKIRSVTRDVFSKYDATQGYASKREAVSNDMFTYLTDAVEKYGIVVEDVEIRSVNPPEIILEKINETKAAQQQNEKMQWELRTAEQQKQKTIIEAQAKAAEIDLINETLNMSPAYLQWLAITKLQDNVQIIYTPDGSVPMVHINKE